MMLLFSWGLNGVLFCLSKTYHSFLTESLRQEDKWSDQCDTNFLPFFILSWCRCDLLPELLVFRHKISTKKIRRLAL